MSGFSSCPQSRHTPAWPGCAAAKARIGRTGQHSPIALQPRTYRMPAETKDPSGGTTGRVKPYGAWGGWALAPNTASMGRDYRSHGYRSRKLRRTFNGPAIYLAFVGTFSEAFPGKTLPQNVIRREDRFVHRGHVKSGNWSPVSILSKQKRLQTENYWAAGRLPPLPVGLPEASCRSEVLSEGGASETATTGTADTAPTAETAAKASASPAPN
jgi:hypothetical protein